MSDIDLTNSANAELVFAGVDGEPFTTSLVIATESENEHRAVLQLIRSHLGDLNEIGRVAFEMRPFETAGGTQRREVAVLDEPAAALLMTYLKNTAPVRDFKKRLVRDFYRMRTMLAGGLDLSDPIAAIEAVREREGRAIEIARAERTRADKAEKRVEIEQRHRRAIEAGDGILLTDFGKKYFSEVRHTDFFEHLYAKKWLIDQRGTRIRPDGEVRDGHDHRKPAYKGRPFIYEHDTGVHGGQRRFQPRVRPQKEIELRDALAAEGLPVNTHSTGLVLITNDEMKELGA